LAVLVATNACQQNQIVTDSEVKMSFRAGCGLRFDRGGVVDAAILFGIVGLDTDEQSGGRRGEEKVARYCLLPSKIFRDDAIVVGRVGSEVREEEWVGAD
jgi:hypothetical protein